jgi:Tfp pilus assembly protein PilF
LLDQGDAKEATWHLERAVQLDPLLQQAVQLLRQAYVAQGRTAQAEDLIRRYRSAMGFQAMTPTPR